MADRQGDSGRSFTVLTGGGRIRWRRGGGQSRLLLVPGFGGDGSCWGAAFPGLLSERGVAPVVYDPRGLGGSSSGLSAPSLEAFAGDAAAVAEDAGAPLAVMGWSMGASVAAELALARPELVSSLILCCCAADHRRAAEARPHLFGPLADGSPSGAALALAEALAPPRGWNAAFERALRRNLSDFFSKHKEAIRGQQAVLKNLPPLADVLGRLSLPVMAVVGEGDRLIPPGEGAALAAAKDLILKTLPGGHGLVYERPKELADLVAAFIRGDL